MYRFDEVWDYLSEIRCTISIIYIDLETVSWIENFSPFLVTETTPKLFSLFKGPYLQVCLKKGYFMADLFLFFRNENVAFLTKIQAENQTQINIFNRIFLCT